MRNPDPRAAPATAATPVPAGAGQVQSVARAFGVLEVLAEADAALPLAEIAARAGLAVPTAHRLLRTLVELGAARQLDTRDYALGPRLIGLGERATPPLAESARGALVRLEDIAQETANLAVLDGDLVAYVAQVPSRHRMRMFTEVGRRVLPHASGVGKAMLATLPERRVREILDRTGLPAYTPTTLPSADAVIADLRETRRRGFAIDDGEQEVGVRCIAVAVPGAVPPAALSISGPSARMTDAIVERAVAELTRAARELGAA
ncbi:IclR family transcriptional regulator [Leucobacter luti]|uniref:Glycerol operon regulatory protein n=1 Tax=Leucobacter luti TaxID=340320 RepID=A0A4Q7TSM3_9MICO|nr:IclR family transcriptional regulator [Leucobacter luti]MBL3699966.1 IclR family transcriptional regulator [Leucobacter luti]RZT62718.1 IclR family transcriptional regulator [Leucobacter luti]